MPTPVSAARQCLAPEAVAALEEAVAVARRRCHAQTTSLHVVSALLSLPSSSSSLLRDALSRARNAAYSPRLQFKALELCFSVALDRLPSSSTASTNSSSTSTVTNMNNNSNSNTSSNNSSGACANAPTTPTSQQQQQEPSEPPVSNSLMAAIKRSQANQRRNPETFHLYHHQQATNPQSPSFAGVKVELQQLVLSILDDPVVSRVFGEAGFRSCDIKLAVLRPPPSSVLRFPRAGAAASRCPPLFLCNFASPVPTAADELDPLRPAAFSFPFSRHLLYSDGSEENSRRIGELLARGKGRNPLLVGAGAAEAARDFLGVIARQKWSALPLELAGLTFFSIEKDVADFAAGGGGLRDRSYLESKLRSLESMLTEVDCRFRGPGTLVSFGDLKAFVEDAARAHQDGEEKELGGVIDDGACTPAGLGYVVAELTRLVTGPHSRRLWLMGSSASYEIYMKFLAKYPSLDKDWDLQLLPITAVKLTAPGSFPRPNSLTESFIPFGGFFPVASNAVMATTQIYHSASPCNHCNEKIEQDIATTVKEYSISSLDMNKTKFPSWLCNTASVGLEILDTPKAQDDRKILNDKDANIQRKWNDASENLHHAGHILEEDKFYSRTEVFPRIIGFPLVVDNQVLNQMSHDSNLNQGNMLSLGTCTKKTLLSSYNVPLSIADDHSDRKVPSLLDVRPSTYDNSNTEGSMSHSSTHSDLGVLDDHASPSIACVSTDLVLGSAHVSSLKEGKPNVEAHFPTAEIHHWCSQFLGTNISTGGFTIHPDQSPFCHSCAISSKLSLNSEVMPQHFRYINSAPSSFDLSSKYLANTKSLFDFIDLKLLYQTLMEKVGWQQEAIYEICESISRCKMGKGQHQGIWLSFLGPDRMGKKKVAMALTGLLFGKKGKFIYFDLDSQEGYPNSNKICNVQVANNSDKKSRGKTVVDCIAAEISSNPWSIVFIENVDKADVQVQRSLDQAITTGRFSDSHKREVNINNSIIVTTARDFKNKFNQVCADSFNFCEDRILAIERWQMKILIESISKPSSFGMNACLSPTSLKESFIELNHPCFVYINKRKIHNIGDCKEEFQSLETTKRAHKSFNTLLDLNVPFQETVEFDSENSSDESSVVSECSETWLERFYESIDKTIIFKPFNFDALGVRILEEINKCFLNTIGSKCVLEIDPKAMEQLIAATWILEEVEVFNNWLQQVLARCFMEVRERYNLSTQAIFRLVACENETMEEQAQGICLPSRILIVES